jgi:hypothetical protein
MLWLWRHFLMDNKGNRLRRLIGGKVGGSQGQVQHHDLPAPGPPPRALLLHRRLTPAAHAHPTAHLASAICGALPRTAGAGQPQPAGRSAEPPAQPPRKGGPRQLLLPLLLLELEVGHVRGAAAGRQPCPWWARLLLRGPAGNCRC